MCAKPNFFLRRDPWWAEDAADHDFRCAVAAWRVDLDTLHSYSEAGQRLDLKALQSAQNYCVARAAFRPGLLLVPGTVSL